MPYPTISTPSRRLFAVGLLLLCAAAIASTTFGAEAEPLDKTYRWNGRPFVFVFTTDDGTSCNLGWAEVARRMDFRFTIGCNPYWKYSPVAERLTPEEMHTLWEDGFEIANHTYSHCKEEVPLTCPAPPRGSLMAYFDCEDLESCDADRLFHAEIERDSLATIGQIPVAEIRTLQYPRHRYSHAIIDSLIAEGYIGARFGANSSFYSYGNEEYDEPARNAWDEGISLFRIPLTAYAETFFGNHSADPPVHFTYEQFAAAAQPYIDQAIVQGGMFVIYAHHFGDYDTTWGNYTYGSGGVTPEELEWIVDLVRCNGGTVMTLNEAIEYYRARSNPVNLDGDYVWTPRATAVELPDAALRIDLEAYPNPFNALTSIDFEIPLAGPIAVSVFDLHGSRVANLLRGSADPGAYHLDWNGRTDTGRDLPSGVYGVVIDCAAGRATRRVTLLK